MINPKFPNLLAPSEIFALLRPFYYSVGKRFATPVNLRLQGPLKALNLDANNLDLKMLMINSIKNRSRGLMPLMRSAFLDGVVTLDITGFRGLASRNAVFKSGPPDLHTSGVLFIKLMHSYAASLDNSSFPSSPVREDLTKFNDEMPRDSKQIQMQIQI